MQGTQTVRGTQMVRDTLGEGAQGGQVGVEHGLEGNLWKKGICDKKIQLSNRCGSSAPPDGSQTCPLLTFSTQLLSPPLSSPAPLLPFLTTINFMA